jgi:hypothetical protein
MERDAKEFGSPISNPLPFVNGLIFVLHGDCKSMGLEADVAERGAHETGRRITCGFDD